MPEQLEFTVDVLSPRHGHNDKYSIKFNNDGITIDGVSNQATYVAKESGEMIWTGYSEMTGNPLVKLLENDHIYPPSVFVWALESVWRQWLDDEIKDAEVIEEVNKLFEWLNTVSRNMPDSDFWIGMLG